MNHEDIDSRILSACAMSEAYKVQNLLPMKPSWDALLSCFHMALASESIELIQLLTPHLNLSTPNGKRGLYLNILKYYASEGSKPEVIYSIQQLLRPTDLAEQHRHRAALQKQGHLKADSFYIADDNELILLKEIKLKINKLSSGVLSTSRRERWFHALKYQNWINDCFLDASKGDRRLLVNYLIRLTHESTLRPSQSTINTAFGFCCERGRRGMASIVAHGIDQAGFDDAVSIANSENQAHILTWLLSGRLGFAPTEFVVDELYQIRFQQLIYRADRSQGVPLRLRGRRRIGVQPNDEESVHEKECFHALGTWVSPQMRQQAEDALQRRSHEAELARTRQAVARNFSIHQADIHDYSASSIAPSNTPVEVPEAMTETSVHQNLQFPLMQQQQGRRLPRGGGRSGNGLNAAVLEHLYSRVPIALYQQRYESTETVIRRLGEIVDTHISPSDHPSAMRILGDLLNQETSRMFGFIIAFLETLHEEDTDATHQALGTWIQGFLTESVQMNSCNPGAMERAVTGLRGIGDYQLDRIFAQAEGPRLVNLFLRGSFNIFDEVNAARNAPRLAQELVNRHATAASTENDILQMLIAYATEQVTTFGVDPNQHMDEIRVIMEMLSDNYHTHLKSYVLTELNRVDG